MSIIKEFKEFAMKGSLIEISVAFIMGAAFGKVTTALIDGVIMPIVGELTTGVDFKAMKYVLREAQYDASGKILSPENAIQYGNFITIFIDFILVAFVMFLLIKMTNRFKSSEEKTNA
ncbi:large conductance mechanosensitive channel protein MscL [Aquirufa beregesia]|nr:large conductance mechanosensitive channel protein MscL [Aquirufa beregesia]